MSVRGLNGKRGGPNMDLHPSAQIEALLGWIRDGGRPILLGVPSYDHEIFETVTSVGAF